MAATAKALYELQPAQQQSILSYSATNQSYVDDLEQTTLADDHEVKVNNAQHNNRFNLIQQLLPVPTDNASNTPTLDSIFKLGFRAAASNPRIRDPLSLIELLLEQARVFASTATQPAQVAEYMMYSLQLVKLLMEFGLQAATEFHFKCIRQLQQSGGTLTAEQPMLFAEMTSKFRRLSSYNQLNSIPVNFNSQSKAKPRLGTFKFSGKPCEFHTSKLGRPANHSDAECRAKPQKN